MAQTEEKKKNRKIYSTESINQIIKDIGEGYDADYSPFYDRDINLRAANVPFLMTQEEVDEFQKVVDDPLYYVEHYCKFLTDDGLSLVTLRDFQKNVIQTVTDEVYDENINKVVPKNRNVIWMASRQSGKCVTARESITYIDSELSKSKHNNLINFYNKYTKDSFIKRIKSLLYKLYCKL